MKWVTWENVGVDRMACAWLIQKFIDPTAEFTFIPVGAKSIPEGAEAFDIPGVRLSHYRGHCSFHTMLREYEILDPILHRIARIVDEADIVQEVSLEPTTPGLDAICRGIRMNAPDDVTATQQGALIYDALYAVVSSQEI